MPHKDPQKAAERPGGGIGDSEGHNSPSKNNIGEKTA